MDINKIEGVQKRFTKACLLRMTLYWKTI